MPPMSEPKDNTHETTDGATEDLEEFIRSLSSYVYVSDRLRV